MNDWLEIFSKPLPVTEAAAFVADHTAGGISVFLGTTRADTNMSGHALIALNYEAYEEMALKQFASLAERARRKWPVIKLVIHHRTGRVALAEPSVLIAVSTPHRADAFDACRWLIDTLKSEAPIWKKEIWSDGPATWVERETTAEN